MNRNRSLPVTLVNRLNTKKDISLVFPFYVFLYVTEGETVICQKDEEVTFRVSDFFLLPPNRHVQIKGSKNCQMVLLGIAGDFIRDHLDISSMAVCNSVQNPDADYLNLKRVLLELVQLKLSGQNDDLKEIGLCFMLASELKKIPGTTAPFTRVKYADRLHEIVAFIDEHYAQPLSLSDLAEEFYLTPQYMSSFFKKNFGMNFKTYLNQKRLFYSLRDLRSTSLPIGKIALSNGFNSFSAYRKNFENVYQMSPSEFRKQRNVSDVQADSDTAAYISVDNRKGIDYSASLRENYQLQAAGNEGNFDHVDHMVNLGSARRLMSDQFRRVVVRAQKELGFDMVRLQGLISSSFIPKILPDYEYYFLYVDTVLDFLMVQDLMPIFELSRQEFDRTIGNIDNADYIYILRTPRYYELLEAFLEHVTAVYPKTWLAGWKFELWAQPREETSCYLHDFSRIRGLLMRYLPNACLGGPGFHACDSPVSLEEWIGAFAAKGVKPKFFSIYADYRQREEIEGGGVRATLSTDPDALRKLCQQARRCLRRYFSSVPLYVTEWNSISLSHIPVAYSRYQAAFVIKSLLELDQVCDLSAYTMLTDINQGGGAFQKNRLDRFLSGPGMVSPEEIPMPAYYAYREYRGLGSAVISRGRNYVFIRREEDNYQLVTYHYDHFRAESDPEIRDASDFDKLYRIFPVQSPVRIDFMVLGLTPGLYVVDRTMIDEFSSNFMDVLIREYEHSDIDKIAFLQRIKGENMRNHEEITQRTIPERRRIYFNSKGELHLESILSAHAVCVWNFRRQL